jgi:uncharacterized membrane protein YfcA
MFDWLAATLGAHGLTLIFLAMILGSILQGSVGYGMALVASPILIMIEPRLIPGPYTLASLLLSVLMLLRERRSMDIRGVSWALVGRVPGTILAGLLLAVASGRSMILIFGVMVLVGVVISVAGWRFPPRPGNLFFAGLLSAIMGTVATIGGPPMALVYQDAAGDQLRSTLSGYFIVGGLLSLVTLIIVGRFGQTEVWLSVALLPGILCGYLVSSRLLPLFKSQNLRPIVLAVATVSALFVILREVLIG